MDIQHSNVKDTAGRYERMSDKSNSLTALVTQGFHREYAVCTNCCYI